MPLPKGWQEKEQSLEQEAPQKTKLPIRHSSSAYENSLLGMPDGKHLDIPYEEIFIYSSWCA